MRRDLLLDEPLLNEEKLESFCRDFTKEPLALGQTILWKLVLAEMNRRQVNAQLHHARALTWAPWALS
jgi:hypothetical protein